MKMSMTTRFRPFVPAAVAAAVLAACGGGGVDIATLNTINIAKNAAPPELAYQFINYLLKPDIQQALGAAGVDAPVAKDAKLSPAEAKQWVYGAEMVSKLKTLDYDKLNAAKGGGYLPQSDHSVPSNVSAERYEFVLNLLRRHGKYPLQLGKYDIPGFGREA